jgi:hypothetical protein
MARPRRRPAPVTSATFPFRSIAPADRAAHALASL